MMAPELKAEWVEALRSGKYEQGRGRLYGEGKFCCLGVLCELSRFERLEGSSDAYGSRYSYEGDSSFTYPTGSMMKRWDADADEITKLADLNDRGLTFEALANNIEQNALL